jgi:predicted nucleic acid-binding Zn ribbon protein
VFRLGDLLADALHSLLGSRRARQAAVLDAWPEVVGGAHARHTTASGIRGNALVVVTDLPAVSHELGLRRAALIDALNCKVGGAAIEDIQIVVRPQGERGTGGPAKTRDGG